MLTLGLAACGEFKRHRVIESGTGLYATVGVPVSSDAYTVCISDRPLETCSRRKSVFYGYRSRTGNIEWISPNVLQIAHSGGEVRKGPPSGAVRVGDRSVVVRLEYTD